MCPTAWRGAGLWFFEPGGRPGLSVHRLESASDAEHTTSTARKPDKNTHLSSPASAKDAAAVDLNDHVRNHWGIENKSHYVRDTVWHEDAQHINNGTAPHVKATLTNTANSLLRLHGRTDIKRTTEWISRDPLRALALLVTQRE
jgi:predicted transposase YbfD/YdcC